jgi:hypothetical protein
VVALVCGQGAVLLAEPSVGSAGSCASLAGVKAFTGTASTSFSGSASGSDGTGGTKMVSLSRTASGLRLNLSIVGKGPTGTTYGAHPGQSPSGGSISVNDNYADNNPSGNTSGSESGSGSTVSEGSAAVVNFFPGSCTYQLAVQWAIDTTPSGTATPGDNTASAWGQTPLRSIPASLKLSGSVTVPDYGSGPDCSKIQRKGCYGNNGGWASEYDSLFSGPPEGSATITWNLTPSAPKSCSIDGGGTTASAVGAVVAQQSPEPVACRTGSPEPTKIYTEPEKNEFRKEKSDLVKKYAQYCGTDLGDPLIKIRALLTYTSFAFLNAPCIYLNFYIGHLESLIQEPPDPAVLMVALPVVPPGRANRVKCPFTASQCR